MVSFKMAEGPGPTDDLSAFEDVDIEEQIRIQQMVDKLDLKVDLKVIMSPCNTWNVNLYVQKRTS